MIRSTSRPLGRRRPSRAPLLFDLVTSTLLGLGLLLVAAPAVFLWLIHGSDDRYLWLISGPRPFDQWGSGPYQLWICVMLGFAAACCLSSSVVLRRTRLDGELPRLSRIAVVFAVTGVVAAAFALAGALLVIATFG